MPQPRVSLHPRQSSSMRNPIISKCRSNTRLHNNNDNDYLQSPDALFLPQISGNIMTLNRFIIEATRTNPDHADFESLISSIQIGCKSISNMLSRSGLGYLSGLDKQYNPSEKTDVSVPVYDVANTILKNVLRFTGKIGVISSETDERPMLVEEAWNSKYIAVFDPLDGASNIDVGIVTGTIFGIFREDDECLTDFGETVGKEATGKLLRNLQPAKNLVAAGYCMYSSSTVMMISIGDGMLLVC